MTFRTVVFISLCLSVGLAWIIESGATDVFLEATRPDFQKIPLGVAGIDNSGGADSPAGRIRLGLIVEGSDHAFSGFENYIDHILSFAGFLPYLND